MSGKITFKSQPLTLAGRTIKEGMTAPRFTATDVNLKEVKLSDYENSFKVITSFLSLDTPVCDLQVKEFNKRAAKLGDDIVIIGISQDLPFAHKRFCEANEIDNVIALSDYKTNSFAFNYGLHVKELNLLARAVIIVDKGGIIRYARIVSEATDSPDYDEALESLDKIILSESPNFSGSASSRCVPCESGSSAMSEPEASEKLKEMKDWELIEGKTIKKSIKFKTFSDAVYFVNQIGSIAEEQGHHPDIVVNYNKVTLHLTTHSIKGLSDNDFIMAAIIDDLAGL